MDFEQDVHFIDSCEETIDKKVRINIKRTRLFVLFIEHFIS